MTRRGRGTLLGVVGLGVLAYAVVLLAAASGPAQFVGSGAEPTGTSTPEPLRTATPTIHTFTVPRPDGDSHASAALGSGLKLLMWAVGLVVAAYLLRWLWRWVRRLRVRALLPRIDRAEPRAAAPALPLDTSDARAALREIGTPRNAIVRAWFELESAAAATGLPPHDAETPAEYTRRVLAERSVTPAVIGRLADLFREARFSDHPVTEEHRQEAIDAFLTLDLELRGGVRA